MNAGEDARTDNRKDRHRFRGTVDGCTPVLLEQAENRGDKRAA